MEPATKLDLLKMFLKCLLVLRAMTLFLVKFLPYYPPEYRTLYSDPMGIPLPWHGPS
jgi:hypothetical protein